MTHTMKDVAERAGVSAATISRVLNNTHYIADDTRKRVLDAVKELGYFKNVNARRLATGRSELLGLVISEITNPYFAEVIRGFQAAAWDSGMDTLLFNTEYSGERAKSIIKKLVESDVRGVAIMTSSIECGETAELIEAGIGAVFCNLCQTGRLVSSILVDYGRGISQAIEHVASLGHRRIAVIGGPEGNGTAANIRRALVAELRKEGLTPTSVASCNYRVDSGASAVQEILSAADVPTAVFCGSDLIAMGAMNALQEAGVRVPEDVSIVGIDNLPFAFLTRPPLTTVSVPREEIGLRAFQALDRMLQLKRRKGTEYILETELVIRKSTGPARAKGLRITCRQP